ncbi:hypothetical protein ACFO3K_19940 [Cellulomonas algicola]|uniref:Cysteine dioxygenase n=1 Tax=Cellulomonas algicola TaxID=2071633 RepID=A0A401V1L3_9CELL|nr:hypothetical protein [Cellulomonas algicola]GCD20789.1 hypothetical protein CTKZ_23510 [Cellulomonas algicola]
MPSDLRTTTTPTGRAGVAPHDFDDLRAQLVAATRGPRDSDALAQAGRLLTTAFADRAGGAALLSSWADRLRDGRTTVRGRSQVHHNGFAKISLARLDGGWNLRLHVWPAGQGDARVHDHRWSFASIAVDGALDVVNYSRDTGPDDEVRPCYRLYDATGDGEKRLERAPDEAVRPTSSYRIGAGAFHVLDFRDPHVVRNTTATDAVTLMLSGPARREFSHSYGARDRDDVLPAPALVDDERAIDHVRLVAARLRSA